MKIRNGFVSNSSSTSFVLLTTEKKLDEVMGSFNEMEREFLDRVIGDGIKGDGLGHKDLWDFSGTYNSESLYDIYYDVFLTNEETKETETEYDYVKADELFSSFIKKFKGQDESYSSYI